MSPTHASSPVSVGLVQFKPRKGDVAGNLERVRSRIAEAAPDHDLLVFPEASLSGYFLEGAVAEAALHADELLERLGPPPPDAPDVVIGFYERWRRRLHNSAAYLTASGGRWEIVHAHRKMFLPTYGVFDEARFVEAGTGIRAFDTRFGPMGVLICEEMWHSLPATVLALGGAELLVVVSASPARDFGARGMGRPRNLERWDRLATTVAEEHAVFVVVSQLVGSEGGKMFPGGSIAVAPDGEVLARGPLFEEAVVGALIDPTAVDRARLDGSLLADLEQMLPHLERSLARAGEEGPGVPAAPSTRRNAPSLRVHSGDGAVPRDDPSVLAIDAPLVERTLVEFIREELVRRRGFQKAVIAVSGGVDSAVSLYLAVKALGRDNVYGFRLPYATSSPESLEHAALALEATGAHDRTIEITDAIDAYVTQEPDLSPQRRGNLMARLRFVILFDQSFKLHALPIGTGNKSERLLGYFTWHADDSPPINPLGDLFKTQVWSLARHLGVPDLIVDKPATADLIKGVNDEDELGIGYPRADLILYWLLKGYRPDELMRAGFGEGEVQIVSRRLNGTHWKRELPTVAILSSSAIGEFYLRPVDY